MLLQAGSPTLLPERVVVTGKGYDDGDRLTKYDDRISMVSNAKFDCDGDQNRSFNVRTFKSLERR